MLDEKRKGRITGSIAGAILGYAPYMTRDDAMRTMCRQWQGLSSEFEGNAATEWGKFNESGAILDFELETGLTVSEIGFKISPEYDWLGATPDGVTSNDSLIEVKCPYGLRNEERPVFKTIQQQMHYYVQMQIEMHCAGFYECYFYQWTPASTYLQFVEFDSVFFEEIIVKLRAFYEEYLIEREDKEKYSQEKIKEIDAPQFYDAYIKAKNNLAVAEEALEAAKNDLVKLANGKKSKIGDLLIYEVEREGSISYAKAIKDLLPNAQLDEYKGKPSKYWVIK